MNYSKKPLRRRKFAPAVMAALERRVMLASPFIDVPALPQVYLDTTYVPGTGQTINVPAGGNLQTAIDSANFGDTIVLVAGATYLAPTTPTAGFSLPNKGAGNGWITIRTSAPDSELPAPGTRITPAHAHLMPKLVADTDRTVLGTTDGAHHYRFIGIEFTITSNITRHTTGIVRLGSGSETTLAQFPHNLIFDRCYIHGNATGNIQNGMRLNSASTAVIDSYFDQCQAVSATGVQSFESHNIGGYNGPGPYKLVNNTFSSATIPVIFGGANTSMTNMVPTDLEIRNNHFTRPLSWRSGDPSYDGSNWYVKNLFELKNARRVLFDGNLLEHNWPQSGATPDGSPQHGFAILLTTKGSQSWTTVEDITLTNNVVRKSNAGISLSGTEGQGAKRINIANNLFDQITWASNGVYWGNNDRSGLFSQVQAVGDMIFDHNTIINDGDIMFVTTAEPTPVKTADLDFTNNISNHNAARSSNVNRGINGRYTGVGSTTLNSYFNQHSATKNVMANAAGYTGNYTGSAAGNFFPSNFSSVGFMSLANRDYRLNPATSTYDNAATDGTDIGANFTTLEAAVAGAISLPINGTSGNDTYYLKRSGNLLEIYNNATGTGTPILRDMYVYYESLMLNTGDGNDTIIVDYTNGTPIPAGGIFFDGGNATDTVQIIGNNTAATHRANATSGTATFHLAGAINLLNSEVVSATNLASLNYIAPLAADAVAIDNPQAGKNRIIRGVAAPIYPDVLLASTIPITIDAATNEAPGGSVDTLSVNAVAGSSIRFIGGSGNDSMSISGGSLTFNSDLGADSSALALIVQSTTSVTFAATQHLRSLFVNGTVTMPANGSRLLVVKSPMTGSGKLNLNDNAMIVDYTGGSVLATVNGQVATGRNGGSWNGPSGIVTGMSEAIAPSTLTTLGVAEASNVLNYGAAQTALWRGQTVDKTAVLVRYTYTGDATLDGRIDGDDYFAIDSGFAAASNLYARGNFNYTGVVDADDYFLLDVHYSRNLPALLAAPAGGSGAELPTASSFTPASTTTAYQRLLEQDEDSAQR